MKEVVTYLASTGHAARGAKRKGAGPGAARQARGKVGKGDDELEKAMSAPTPTEVRAPVVVRESASAVVTGIVADEDMDEDVDEDGGEGVYEDEDDGCGCGCGCG